MFDPSPTKQTKKAKALLGPRKPAAKGKAKAKPFATTFASAQAVPNSGIWGLGFRGLGLGFRVWGLGFREHFRISWLDRKVGS